MRQTTLASHSSITRAPARIPVSGKHTTTGLNRSAVGLAVLTLLTQRVAVSFGEFSLPIPAALILGVTLIELARGRWQVAPLRAAVFLGFVASAAISIATSGGAPTMASALIYVLVLWFPAVAIERRLGNIPISFAVGAVVTTALSGYAGAIQSFFTLAGGNFVDPLSQLPPEFQVPGYKSDQTVDFGGSWYKANGLIFLEPSFLSLISAVCLLFLAAGLVTPPKRTGVLIVTGLVLGLFSSAAISGMVIIPIVILALMRSARTVAIASAASILLFLAIWFTPIAQGFMARLFFRQGSNSARLTRPYTELLPAWFNGPIGFGSGPGSARDLADQITNNSWQTEVTTPTLVKLLFEYGLIGASLWCTLLLFVLFASRVQVAVKVGLCAMLIVPTDGLTSHVLVPIFLFTLFSAGTDLPRRIGADLQWST